jgi:ABC-2 type transport system permease protein
VAVYERIWRRYDGGLTPFRWRAAVITRYALLEVFSSRMFTAFYALCLLPTLVAILAVYLSSNTELLASVQGLEGFVQGLTAVFVKFLFIWQAVPAYLIAVIVGPALISADLSNNALSLYLSRPITRAEYLYGKMGVLFLVLAPITWVSGLVVTLMCALLRVDVGFSNLRLAMAYLIGHLIWFLVVSLLTLAVSAWVRFKPAARGALFGIIFILSGFAQAINAVTGTSVGDLIHLTRSIGNVALWILGLPLEGGLPVAASFLTLAGTCLLSIWMLNRKLRAHEVVR